MTPLRDRLLAAAECIEAEVYPDDGELIDVLREAAEALPEWRPIAEAPKDGTLILLTDAAFPNAYLLAQWKRGKWWGQRTNSGRAITWDEASHWRPLPKQPGAAND